MRARAGLLLVTALGAGVAGLAGLADAHDPEAPALDAAPAPVSAEAPASAEDDDEAGADRPAATPPAGAGRPALDAWLRGRLDEAIRARPSLRAARVGVIAVDPTTGQVLLEKDADGGYNIASNAKLVTAAVALARLGPDFRWRTSVLFEPRDPRARPGPVWRGDLVLRGGGDPTLDRAALALLADDVAHAGVKTIEGSLVIDASYFDEDRLPPGFAQKNEDAPFRAPVAALSLDRNAATLRVTPGDAAGAPARIEPEPPSPYLAVQNQVATVATGRTAVRAMARELPAAPGAPPRTELIVRGTIRLDAGPQLVRKRLWHPEAQAGEAFRAMLAARGVRIVKPRLLLRPASPAARTISTRTSEPLAVVVRDLGKRSDNFVAETLLKTLGAEIGGVPGTWAKGLAVAQEWLAGAGLAAGSYRLDNGSGLYDSSRFSPRQLAQVLAAARADFRIAPDYVASLAIAGADGTLTRRFLTSPAARWIRAKTGTLKEVIALAGYAGAPDGRPPVIFAVVVNDVPAGAGRAARTLVDEVATAIDLWAQADAK